MARSVKFTARYPGKCDECGERFPKGTTIIRTVWGEYTHTVCPSDVQKLRESMAKAEEDRGSSLT